MPPTKVVGAILAVAGAPPGVGVPLAATGLVHPYWAMVAMAFSVSAVLANSLGGRLLAISPQTTGR